MQCTVPNIWKRANVSPVHKKMTNAQWITIGQYSLSSVGKTMEKLVHKHVHDYL